MTPSQVIKHFGTINAAARQTGFTRAAFHKWIKQQYIPMDSQWKIKHEWLPESFKVRVPRKAPLTLKIGKPYCKGDL